MFAVKYYWIFYIDLASCDSAELLVLIVLGVFCRFLRIFSEAVFLLSFTGQKLIQCRTEVVRVGIPALLLILDTPACPSSVRYDVSGRVSQMSFSRSRRLLSVSRPLMVLNHKWTLSFVKCFLHYCTDRVNYVDFGMLKMCLRSRGKPHVVMMCLPVNIFLHSVNSYLLRSVMPVFRTGMDL